MIAFLRKTDFHGFRRPLTSSTKAESFLWSLAILATIPLIIADVFRRVNWLLVHHTISDVAPSKEFYLPPVLFCFPWWLNGTKARQMGIDRNAIMYLANIWPGGFQQLFPLATQTEMNVTRAMGALSKFSGSLDDLSMALAYEPSEIFAEAKNCNADECTALPLSKTFGKGVCYQLNTDLGSRNPKTVVRVKPRSFPIAFLPFGKQTQVFELLSDSSSLRFEKISSRWNYRITFSLSQYEKLYDCEKDNGQMWSCRMKGSTTACNGSKPIYMPYLRQKITDISMATEVCAGKKVADLVNVWEDCKPACLRQSIRAQIVPSPAEVQSKAYPCSLKRLNRRFSSSLDTNITKIVVFTEISDCKPAFSHFSTLTMTMAKSGQFTTTEIDQWSILNFVTSIANQASLICGASLLSILHLFMEIAKQLLSC